MSTLRQMSAATILSLTLAVPVFAGHIETPGAKPSPTPTQSVVSTTTSTTTTTTATSIMLIILRLLYT